MTGFGAAARLGLANGSVNAAAVIERRVSWIGALQPRMGRSPLRDEVDRAGPGLVSVFLCDPGIDRIVAARLQRALQLGPHRVRTKAGGKTEPGDPGRQPAGLDHTILDADLADRNHDRGRAG